MKLLRNHEKLLSAIINSLTPLVHVTLQPTLGSAWRKASLFIIASLRERSMSGGRLPSLPSPHGRKRACLEESFPLYHHLMKVKESAWRKASFFTIASLRERSMFGEMFSSLPSPHGRKGACLEESFPLYHHLMERKEPARRKASPLPSSHGKKGAC